jgi:hypothetical protein
MGAAAVAEAVGAATEGDAAETEADAAGKEIEQEKVGVEGIEEKEVVSPRESSVTPARHACFCFNFQRGKCGNGDACPYSHTAAGSDKYVPVQCKFHLRGSCRHGRRCRNLHEGTPPSTASTAAASVDPDVADAQARRSLQRKGELYLPKPLEGGSRGTLLRKLLRDRIDQEANVVLQCIRHLAKHLQASAAEKASAGAEAEAVVEAEAEVEIGEEGQ